jgi:D-3-phosphoglycerate dehydrogenase
LKLISQTGKLAGHVDVAAATDTASRLPKASARRTAPAELTWALIMAAAARSCLMRAT